MNSSNVKEIARNGSVEDVANLLRSHGKLTWVQPVDGFTDCLDTISNSSLADENKARKARKVSLIAAYSAYGVDGLKNAEFSDAAPLKTLKDLAFNSSAEKLAELLTGQADNPAALQAIVDGAKKDCDRRSFRGTTRDRRTEKKDVLFNFFAKAGPFAPVTTNTPHTPSPADIQDKQKPAAEQKAQEETVNDEPVKIRKSVPRNAPLKLRAPQQ